MTIIEAIERLRPHYHLEKDDTFLYVRTTPNSVPTKLRISWLGTVSDRSVKRLENSR